MKMWKKVDLTQPPFFFSEEGADVEIDHHLTNEYTAVYHKAIQKELAGKNLEYLWGEESVNEPDYLEDFECDGWDIIFKISADHCFHFTYVTMGKGPCVLRYPVGAGVRWVINFECLSPIWIREVL